MTPRDSLLETVAARIEAVAPDPLVRVAIDGRDGAGKTFFADELARLLTQRGHEILRASVDGFHNPRSVRYRLGRNSPEGYFRDSYNYAALKECLFDPLSPGGTGRYRPAAFDHRTDAPVPAPWIQARPGVILLLDGIFLHRPELRDCWSFSIFLAVSPAESIARCASRDGATPPETLTRYVDGQNLYLRECDPARVASIVIDNNNLAAPAIVARNSG